MSLHLALSLHMYHATFLESKLILRELSHATSGLNPPQNASALHMRRQVHRITQQIVQEPLCTYDSCDDGTTIDAETQIQLPVPSSRIVPL